MGEFCYKLKMAMQDAFVINGADQSKKWVVCCFIYQSACEWRLTVDHLSFVLMQGVDVSRKFMGYC